MLEDQSRQVVTSTQIRPSPLTIKGFKSGMYRIISPSLYGRAPKFNEADGCCLLHILEAKSAIEVAYLIQYFDELLSVAGQYFLIHLAI